MRKAWRFNSCEKIISGLMAFIFAMGSAGPSYARNVVSIPAPGTMVSLSEAFAPPLLKGVKVYPDNPFRFDFILDKGDALSVGEVHEPPLRVEAKRLIKYFLASITVPEKDLWVNLSPYEKERIVPDAFGVTEMGRDLLAQDYLLKQITASVLYPEGDVGKVFWAKVYAEAQKRYGTTDIPVDTFNKVWIVPEKAAVYESRVSAYVVESRLKVMLETDYLAQSVIPSLSKGRDDNDITRQVLREVIIPILEKEVNEGRNFAQLRQVYHSLILATWLKKKLAGEVHEPPLRPQVHVVRAPSPSGTRHESPLHHYYVDQNKTGGIDIQDKADKDKIWTQYVEAFKKGAVNYILEDPDPATQQPVPRKYFSGGAGFNHILDPGVYQKTSDRSQLSQNIPERGMIVAVELDTVMPGTANIPVQIRGLQKELTEIAAGRAPTPKEMEILKNALRSDPVQAIFQVDPQGASDQEIVDARIRIMQEIWSPFSTWWRESLHTELVSTDTLWRVYIPLSQWVVAQKRALRPQGVYILGINGSPGRGKTFLSQALIPIINRLLSAHEGQVVIRSMDHYTKSKKDRDLLRQEDPGYNPEGITNRGLPGTHYTDWIRENIAAFDQSTEDSVTSLANYDKLADDQLAPYAVKGKVGIFILEGGEVGASTDFDLNDIPPGFKRVVAGKLQKDYKAIFDRLDALFAFQTPDFDQIVTERIEQDTTQFKTTGRREATDEETRRRMQYVRLDPWDHIHTSPIPPLKNITFLATIDTHRRFTDIHRGGYDPAPKGGIDLTRDKMNLQIHNESQGVQLKLDPAMVRRLQNASGLTPVIIDIRPMTTTVPIFLGLKNEAQAGQPDSGITQALGHL